MGNSFSSSAEELPKSPHVVFRLYTALRMFDQSFTSIPAHSIALTRNLILTMKTTFIKALQDYDRIKYCAKCHHSQLKMLQNDLISLLAFPEFVSSLILHQREESGPKALIHNFNRYVIRNSKQLKDKLSDFV